MASFTIQTPGPGTYSVVEPSVYKYKPPQYSMTGRNSLPGDMTQKPGPAAHRPEQVDHSPKLKHLPSQNELCCRAKASESNAWITRSASNVNI